MHLRGPIMRRILLALFLIGVFSPELGAEDATARY
jgi:hypothetical protein